MRDHAGVERLAGQPIGEMAAVADIDLQSPIERRVDDAMDLALPVDEAAGVAGEGVREHVAGFQERNDALENRVCVLAIGAAVGQAP